MKRLVIDFDLCQENCQECVSSEIVSYVRLHGALMLGNTTPLESMVDVERMQARCQRGAARIVGYPGDLAFWPEDIG